jgi:hypothetical protein
MGQYGQRKCSPTTGSGPGRTEPPRRSLDMQAIASIQAPLIGLILILGGLAKAVARTGNLRNLAVALRALGTLEVVVGAGVARGIGGRASADAVLVLFAGSGVYTAAALRWAKGASCGCLGTGTPIGWRSVTRSWFLLTAGAFLVSDGSVRWWEFQTFPTAAIAVCGGECALLCALSDELRVAGTRWVRSVRSIQPRRRLLGSRRREVVTMIESSEYWRSLEESGVLGELSLTGAWQDRAWRVCEYRAVWNGQSATIIAGVTRRREAPGRLKVMTMANGDADQPLQVIASWEAPIVCGPSGRPVATAA